MSWASYWKGANDFLATASASDLVEKAKKAASEVAEVASKAANEAAEAASKVADTVQAEYNRTFVDLDCQIFCVRPELQVMEFPGDDKIDRLSTRLNASHAQRMMILNMSERKYETAKFEGEVVEVAFRGLPSPPLELLMELCLSAYHWLASDAGNILIVHCFQGYSRSAIFLSCFLAFRGLFPHPVDALHVVCETLSISDKSDIVPSQRRYLAYFQQVMQGFSPARGRLRLLRAQLNGVPKFETEGNVAFRPYIEVWNVGEMVYSSLGEGGGLPNGVSASDPCASFQFPEDMFVSGDVLIRIRHVYADGTKVTALRLAFHTGFLPDGFQLAKHELDSACTDSRFSSEAFLDIIFERGGSAEGELEEAVGPPAVYEKARDLARRLAQEERKRLEEEAAAAAAAGGEAKQSQRDEFAELEAALLRGPGAGSSASTSAGSSGGAADGGELAAALAEASSTSAVAGQGGPAPSSAAAATDAAAVAAPPSAPAAASSPAAAKPAAEANEAKRSATTSEAGPAEVDSSEMDNLFNEFDAALASFGTDGGPSKPPAASAPAATAPVATAASSAPAAAAGSAAPTAAPAAQPAAAAPKAAKAAPGAKAKAAGYSPGAAAPVAPATAAPAPAAGSDKKDDKKSTDDDVFGDVDAFLAELDAT